MKIVRINEKCDNCLRCVADCPTGVWRELDGKAEPAAPEFCIRCGHCLSVCPNDAILHDKLDPGQMREVRKELLNEEVYREIALARRSVRQYKKKPVERATLEKIIDLARYSPTASNAQNVEYIVVTDPDLMSRISTRVFHTMTRAGKLSETGIGKLLKKIMSKIGRTRTLVNYLNAFGYFAKETEKGRDYILHHAPALVLMHGPKTRDNGRDNCLIASANIVNYASTLGLGTCFIGFLTTTLRHDRKLKKMLLVPRGHQVFASIVIGYPAVTHKLTVSRKKTKVIWLEA